MVRNSGHYLDQMLEHPGCGRGVITAEAVEKANPLDHFIPDFCLHQSTQNHT